MHVKNILRLILLAIAMNVAAAGQAPTPKTAEAYFAQGAALLTAEKWQEAIDAFRESDKLRPNEPRTHYNIGFALVRLKHPAEAVPEFERAIKLAPLERLAYGGLCNALSSLKKYDEAIRACRDGIRIDPTSENIQAQLIFALRNSTTPPDEVRAAVANALIQFRDSKQILYEASEFYFRRDEFDAAAEMLQRLIAIDDSNAQAHGLLAFVYLAAARDSESVVEARKAIAIDRHNLYSQFFMGRILFQLGQLREAADAFREVLRTDPNLPGARYFLANCESSSGQWDKAIADLQSLVAESPDTYDYQYQLGFALNQVARYEDAILPLQNAVRLDPESKEAMSGLGLSLFESGKLAEATKVLEKANTKWPGDDVILQFMHVTAARVQHLPELDEMKEYAKAHPEDVTIRATLFEGMIFSRRLAEADPIAEEIWKLKPTDVMIYYRVAAAFNTAGERDKAADAYKRSLAIKESAAGYFGLADYYRNRGDFEEASKAFERSLELKSMPFAMKLYADLLAANGKRREALEMYKRYCGVVTTNAGALASASIFSAELGDESSAAYYLDLLRRVDPRAANELDYYLKNKLWR